MTYLIDALEEAKLVTREPDPADRRARRVAVTKRGATLLADLDQRLGQVEAHVLAALDPGRAHHVPIAAAAGRRARRGPRPGQRVRPRRVRSP